MADVSGPRAMRKKRRSIYANLLVDAVRRHALLPSELVDKRLRKERTAGMSEVSKASKAIFSTYPMNIGFGIWWMSLIAFISFAAVVWSFLSMGIEWTSGVGIIESIALAGGQPFYGAGNGTERVIRLRTGDERLLKDKEYGHVGFSIAHSRQTGLSRCGRFEPPKIEVDEIGPPDRQPSISMSLIYPPGGPNSIFGIFLNHGINCSDTTSKCASDTSELSKWFVDISSDNGDYTATVNLPFGLETRSGFKAKSFYSLHTPWPAFFSPGLTFFLWGVAFAMIVVFKFMGMLKYQHTLVCTSLWLISLIEGISTAGFCYSPATGINGQQFESQCESHFYFTCAYFFFASAMTYSPRFPDIWMFFWSFLMLFLMSRADPFFWSAFAKVAPFVLFIMGTSLIIIARFKLRLVNHLEMRRLKASNLFSWHSLRDPHSQEQLGRLERMIWQIAQSIPAGTVARQFNLRFDDLWSDGADGRLSRSTSAGLGRPVRRASSAGSHASSRANNNVTKMAAVSSNLLTALLGSEHSVPEPWSLLSVAPSKRTVSKRGVEAVMAAVTMTGGLVHDPMSPVTSMDQLWVQATLLNGPLKSMVLDLAHRFYGKFPVRGEPGNFESPQDHMWVPSNGRHDLGGVKNIERGTEKVDHAYGGDVSRLLDVCRARIVFEKIKDLGDCVSALMDDETVSIVRIKSSFTKSGLKPVVNTGLRFVSVNMRISNTQTRKLGVSAHVCELLLMLRLDAQASIEGHEDYIRYRNRLSAFHFTIIPGSSIKYEGKRLLLAFGSYLNDLFSSKRANHVVPFIDLGAMPTRGILRVRTIDENKLSERSLSMRLQKRELPPVKLHGSGPQHVEEVPVSVHGKSFGRTPSAWSAPRLEDQEDESGDEGGDKEEEGGGGFGRTPSAWSAPRLEDQEDVKEEEGGGGFGRTPSAWSAPRLEDQEDVKEEEGGGGFGRTPSAWSAPRLEDQEDQNVSASVSAPPNQQGNTLVSIEDALSLLRENTAAAKIKKSMSFEFGDTKTEDEDEARMIGIAETTTRRGVRWVWEQEEGDSDNDDENVYETSYHVLLSSDDICKLECICRIASVGLAQALDRMSTDVDTVDTLDNSRSGTSSLIFLGNLPRMATNFVVQVLAVAMGVLAMLWGVDQLGVLRTDVLNAKQVMKPYYTHFRYVNLADRNGGLDPKVPGVAEFGILHEHEGDCSVRDAPKGIWNHTVGKYDEIGKTTSRVGATIEIVFDRPVPYVGWYLKSPKAGADTRNFDIHAKRSETDEWSLVGRPSWLASSIPEFVAFMLDRKFFMMPDSEEVTLFEPLVHDSLQDIPGLFFFYGVGFFLFGLLGFLRFYAIAPWSMAISSFVAIFLEFVIAEQRSTDGLGIGVALLVLGLARAIFFFLSIFFGSLGHKQIQSVSLHLACVCALASTIVDRVGPAAIGPWYHHRQNPIAFFCVVWNFHILAFIGRIYNRKWAMESINIDKDMYDKMWKAETEDGVEQCAVDNLDRLIQSRGFGDSQGIASSTAGDSSRDLRQYSPKLGRKTLPEGRVASLDDVDASQLLNTSPCGMAPQDTMLSLMNLESQPGVLTEVSQVVSFDQLYIQALLMHDILRGKVESWALNTEGYFPVNSGECDRAHWDTTRYVKWKDVAHDRKVVNRVKWPCVKRTNRAFGKLAISYDRCISRLLDMTRFSIFFDSIEHITVALGAIMSDPDVKLLRVKNTLSFNADVSQTAGYRCVHLNLKIVNRETGMFGCDSHVCEVLLALHSFGELRTPESHGRYIRYRNLRGKV